MNIKQFPPHWHLLIIIKSFCYSNRGIVSVVSCESNRVNINKQFEETSVTVSGGGRSGAKLEL